MGILTGPHGTCTWWTIANASAGCSMRGTSGEATCAATRTGAKRIGCDGPESLETRQGDLIHVKARNPRDKKMRETRVPMPLPDPIQKVATPAKVEAKTGTSSASGLGVPVALPEYLEQTYWWAYLHPRGVSFFERQWLVNLILWGNYRTLRDAVFRELPTRGAGRVLQVACVYGDFTAKLARHLGPSAQLDVVDVAPVQLENLRRKIGRQAGVVLHHQDSADLAFPDQTYDFVVIFFLLHEQPEHARSRTVAEALRVVRPGGKVIFVDYHRPAGLHPLRYVMRPILGKLEPYALDMWSTEIVSWLPARARPSRIEKNVYFGGLYQKVVVTS